MRIVLGNIKWWRFKMVCVLLVCVAGSILAMSIIKNDGLSSSFFWMVLILCSFIMESSWIKGFSYEIYAEDRDTEIYIKKKKKEFVIKKAEIQNVLWKEIRYGGRWLETVGYRLVVIADRKYVFDSVVLDKDGFSGDQDLGKLLKFFQKSA
ncbi:MAG: hypothetical protein HFJ04_04475 [Lachnospiraceae bacterium]|nr:hypothetical protein [Lachnospiraceae bacterium]